MNKIDFEIQGERLQLYGQKAMFWPAKNMLIVADLHLGKATHFRKSGIAAPQKVNDENLDRIISLLQHTQPERVVFLGDLFHSHYNHEWEAFGQVLQHFEAISFELVAGNHDIMSDYQYEKHGVKMHKDTLSVGPFLMTHEPIEGFEGPLYNLSGHIHPGVVLRGTAKQGLRLPCFYFSKYAGLLPAFGAFTGLYTLQPKRQDQVFVIAEGKVYEV